MKKVGNFIFWATVIFCAVSYIGGILGAEPSERGTAIGLSIMMIPFFLPLLGIGIAAKLIGNHFGKKPTK